MKKHILTFITACLLFAGCGTASANTSAMANMTVNARNAGSETQAAEGKTADQFLSLFSGAKNNSASVSGIISSTGTKLEEGYLDLSQFDFFYDVMENGVPADAEFPAVRYAEGEWKYLIDASDMALWELGYAEFIIDYRKEILSIVLHPRWLSENDEVYAEDDSIGYESFDGGFNDNDELEFYGNEMTIIVYAYYASEGREYMLGELLYEDNFCGEFLMTRGQE